MISVGLDIHKKLIWYLNPTVWNCIYPYRLIHSIQIQKQAPEFVSFISGFTGSVGVNTFAHP